MKKFLFILAILTAMTSACSSVGETSPVNLIFDTDMGNDVDDALALDMIYKYVETGDVNLLGVLTSKPERESVEYLDIMRTWYGFEDIPLGVVENGVWDTNPDFRFAKIVCEMKNEDGSPKYERSIKDYGSLPSATKLYRKLLSESSDNSVVIASVGFTTNLAHLLDTGADEYSDLTGRELVARKVKFLSIMGGSFDDGVTLEFNVTRDTVSSKKIFREWPTDMIFSPAELGLKVIYPGTEILKDFYWGGGRHPMVDGYVSYFGPSYDRPAWDLTSVIYAVEGGVEDGRYFSISGPGTVSMNDGGITSFTPSETGHHYILSVDERQASTLVDRFVELTHRMPKAFLARNPDRDTSLSTSAAESSVKVSIPIINDCPVDGGETVQVYIKRDGDKCRPKFVLRGFERVSLETGEKNAAVIELGAQEFLSFNEERGLMEVMPGEYSIFYGNSSAEQNLRQLVFKINGTTKKC